jgi:hypothetical protein
MGTKITLPQILLSTQGCLFKVSRALVCCDEMLASHVSLCNELHKTMAGVNTFIFWHICLSTCHQGHAISLFLKAYDTTSIILCKLNTSPYKLRFVARAVSGVGRVCNASSNLKSQGTHAEDYGTCTESWYNSGLSLPVRDIACKNQPVSEVLRLCDAPSAHCSMSYLAVLWQQEPSSYLCNSCGGL